MDYSKSKMIYKDLILGKYINRRLMEKELVVDSPLFTELEVCFNEYFELYEKIGFILENTGSSFYLVESGFEEGVQKQQIKEYVLMLVIIRGLIESKRNLDGFIDYRYGLSRDEVEKIITSPQATELLESAEISKHAKPVEEILVKRSILAINAKGNYVVTDAGKYFLDEIRSFGSKLLEES